MGQFVANKEDDEQKRVDSTHKQAADRPRMHATTLSYSEEEYVPAELHGSGGRYQLEWVGFKLSCWT